MRGERRVRQRFPLNLEVHFTALVRRRTPIMGVGKVVDISSQGVAFETSTELLAGMSVRANMPWPVALNGDCPLRMYVDGHVVRVRPGLVVMSIGKYEFRTGAKTPTQGRAQLELLARELAHAAPKETE